LSTSAGCGGCSCEAVVCAADDYCCSTEWDKLCVQKCADAGSCPPDGCHTEGGSGCAGCSCEAAVCAEDSYCCSGAWDGFCVDLCIEQGACD
jgi:hypothetical protein